MPDPAKYKGDSKQKYMQDCMHQTRKVEKMPQDQAVAVCLNRWRDDHGGKKPPKRKKKSTSEMLRFIASKLSTYA